jgi:glycosyltransferase involved in cell wall biosynthesis
MISLIAPSRGRPQKSLDTIVKFKDYAVFPFELIVSIDEDDNTEDYINLYSRNWLLDPNGPVKKRIIINKNRSAVDAINNAAKVATGDVLIVVSDDTEGFNHWDELLLEAVEFKSDFILKTQDGIQPWIITMPIMDRAYYNRFGYIYHPDYLHMFCDTELTCVADITGRKLTSNLLFPHKHYSVTKEQPDAINKKADATWAQGEKLFLERYKRNFDLPPGQPIQDKGMINWLQRKIR